MSANIQPLSVVQVNLTGLFNQQRCICTFHYYASGSGTAPLVTVSTFVNDWITKVWEGTLDPNTGLRWMLHEQVGDVTMTGQIVAGTGSRSLLETFVPTTENGSFTGGTALPSGASVVLSRTGQMAGQKNRGRCYLFGVPSGFNTNSNVSYGCETQFALCRDALEFAFPYGTGGNTLTLTPCVTSAGAQPTTAQTGLTYGLNRAIRYQRRREVGVGI